MRLRRGTWAIVAMVLAGSLPAHADSELWFWTEHRQPLPKAASWSPDRLRIGPLWELHPNLFVAFHGVGYADQVRPGVYDQEYRLEAEPNLVWALGDWSFSDRNRLEYRWRPAEQRWRYRNLLRASWRPEGWRVFPYVWDEVLVDLSGLGLNQNRAMVGLSFDLWKGQRLDVGYGLRSRQGSTGVWDHDHLLNLVWFSNPPVERTGGEGG